MTTISVPLFWWYVPIGLVIFGAIFGVAQYKLADKSGAVGDAVAFMISAGIFVICAGIAVIITLTKLLL